MLSWIPEDPHGIKDSGRQIPDNTERNFIEDLIHCFTSVYARYALQLDRVCPRIIHQVAKGKALAICRQAENSWLTVYKCFTDGDRDCRLPINLNFVAFLKFNYLEIAILMLGYIYTTLLSTDAMGFRLGIAWIVVCCLATKVSDSNEVLKLMSSSWCVAEGEVSFWIRVAGVRGCSQ